jgi:hypothetical protein
MRLADEVAQLLVAVDRLPQMAAGGAGVVEPYRGAGAAAVQARLRDPVAAPDCRHERAVGEQGPVVPVSARIEQFGQRARQLVDPVVDGAVPHGGKNRGAFRVVPSQRLARRT